MKTHRNLFKSPLNYHHALLFAFILISNSLLGQNPTDQLAIESLPSKFSLGLNAGYDFLQDHTQDYTYYGLKGGPKFGITGNYQFGKIELGFDIDFIQNSPNSKLGNTFQYQGTNFQLDHSQEKIRRLFFGLGPNYVLDLNKIELSFYGRVGLGKVSGGEMYSFHDNGTTQELHMAFSGYNDLGLAYKGGLDFQYLINEQLSMGLGAYYLRHHSIHPDLSYNSIGPLNINIQNSNLVYGHSPFNTNFMVPELMDGNASGIIVSPEEEIPCSHYASVGASFSLKYRFKSKPKSNKVPKELSNECLDCQCPNDKHKVLVTVKDQISGKVIPNSDVIIKNKNGQVVATATTNSYGIADLGALAHSEYRVEGNVYGIATTIAEIQENEFGPNVTISKDILYTDLRFILKGKVVNKKTRAAEPGVLVNLTNQKTNNVEQTTSEGQGQFAFRLDKSSSYKITGIKQNRLSDVARASTIGLNRSTTLFVDLELGVEDFNCGQGTVLDIKYEFDSAELLASAKFELDKLVRYMKDHQIAKVDLSSHTDSRGSNAYNLDLSQRRAQSAVNYIQGRGIAGHRIIGTGYGETQLKNRCADDINCSESDHLINRRTEAKLICK